MKTINIIVLLRFSIVNVVALCKIITLFSLLNKIQKSLMKNAKDSFLFNFFMFFVYFKNIYKSVLTN